MGDKAIYLAGRPIPINTDAKVTTYVDGFSFYNPAGTASASSYTNMMMRRPSGRVYNARRAINGMRLQAEFSNFGRVTTEELDALRQSVYQVVLHADVTYTSEDCFNVLVSRGLSTHFMINHDGTLHQPLDIYHAAWATGLNNNQCIAIDLNNPIKLEYAARDPANPPRQVFQGKINGPMKVALGYTEPQYATLIALLRALITPLKIDRSYWIPLPTLAQSCFPPVDADGQVIPRLIRNHLEFVGFMGHWHCEAQKWDPGPGFDWNKVLAGVHGERNSFPVILQGGHNLPDLTGAAVGEAIGRYYENIETSETGGWYPIGANQSWHSGVHLHVDQGTPVYAMSQGTILAVRNAKRVDLGDPGFVLVRHEMKSEAVVVEGEEPEPRYWFSVYMHLKQLTTPEELAAVPWVAKLLSGNLEAPATDTYSFDSVDEGFPRHKRPPQVADGTNPLKFATNRGPFFEGDIILCELPVESGEQLGLVGVFGSSEWNLEPQLHVEVISQDNLLEDAAPGAKREWLQIEGDLDKDSLADIKDIIQPILKSAARIDEKTRVLKTSEIQDFFVNGGAGGEQVRFRRMICVHKSEWSPSTQWDKTASSAVGWQWETQEAFSRWLVTWLPFQWMTPDVTSHAKLPESHQFYTYHPFHFLDYLNRSYSGTGQTAEAASDAELTAAQQAEAAVSERLQELMAKIANGEDFTAEEQVEYEELYARADAHFTSDEADASVADLAYDYDGDFDNWEPGEWEPPSIKKKDDDDFGGF